MNYTVSLYCPGIKYSAVKVLTRTTLAAENQVDLKYEYEISYEKFIFRGLSSPRVFIKIAPYVPHQI